MDSWFRERVIARYANIFVSRWFLFDRRSPSGKAEANNEKKINWSLKSLEIFKGN